jgi:hypothetical protein
MRGGGAHAASTKLPAKLTRQVSVGVVADALEKSGVDIVPRVQINTGGVSGAEGGGALQALIGMLLSEKGMAMLDGPSAANDERPQPTIAAE